MLDLVFDFIPERYLNERPDSNPLLVGGIGLSNPSTSGHTPANGSARVRYLRASRRRPRPGSSRYRRAVVSLIPLRIVLTSGSLGPVPS
jgi:hypothetical protein